MLKYILLLCMFLMQNAGAQITTPLVQEASVFDVADANKQLNQIQTALATQHPSITKYASSIKVLTGLISQADDCVQTAEKKIKNFKAMIDSASNSVDVAKTSADILYLSTEEKKVANRQAQCRLFSIRAKEAQEIYTRSMTVLKQEEAFTRGRSLWSLIDVVGHDYQSNQLLKSSASSISTGMVSTGTIVALLLFNILVSIAIAIVVYKNNSYRPAGPTHLRAWFRVLMWTGLGLVTCLVVDWRKFAWVNPSDNALIMDFIWGVSCYFVSVFLLSVVLNQDRMRAFFAQYALDRRFIFSLSLWILGCGVWGWTAQWLGDDLGIKQRVHALGLSLFVLLIILSAMRYLIYFCRAHQHTMPWVKKYQRLVCHVGVIFFLILAVFNVVGYHSFSTHILFASLLSLGIVSLTVLLEQMIAHTYKKMMAPGAMNLLIRQRFGYKENQSLTEFLILKTTLQVFLVIVALYGITQSFGYATHYINQIYAQLLYGIHLGSLLIYPTRIFAGILVFCVFYLALRRVLSALRDPNTVEEGEEKQTAITSILTYIGFSCAFITALLVAGFDFTGLAIVAGALSVGIGLGLQSIVNNFVSGLILLIEKPIKPGDRINVDGVEGTVKKISVRSTRITTVAHEDLIIPNSTLMTQRVTNYTFSDKHLLISCDVGVAYGSDPVLVQELLLSVTQHDDIIRSARHKPTVLFRAFGESSLLFRVSCLIKDGKKKTAIQSDLNFAIERVLRAHKIELAVPQREVHLILPTGTP